MNGAEGLAALFAGATLNNGGMSSDYDAGPNMSYSPNMSMADGSTSYNGVITVENAAAGAQY